MADLSSSLTPPPPLTGQTVAVVGLGHMGKPMARNLHAAGARVLIYNRSQEVVEELKAEGMEAPENLAELARALGPGGTLILMLISTEVVEEILFGPADSNEPEAELHGLAAHLEPGTLVIDMSTTEVDATRRIAEALANRKCPFVDAPVSGGEVGAIEGELIIMAGGEPSAVSRAMPLFEVMGQKTTHMGPAGSGQVTKLANQVIVALTVDAVAEALVLAEAAGVDPGKVREALRGGFADSRILELQGERMVKRSFEPGGKTTYQLKDIRYACQLMEDCGIELPTLISNRALWEKMIDQGKGDLDHSGLFTLFADQLER